MNQCSLPTWLHLTCFIKSKTFLKRTAYHSIYRDDGLVVFKENKSVQEINDWLADFQQTLDKAVGNQHLQFTAKIWTNEMNIPPSAKKDKDQIMTNDEFPFLVIKII